MALLDQMPGVAMPVSEVSGALRELWTTDEGEAPTKFRAVQSNLILHFGLATTDSEAKGVLDRALEFARRYPCRLVCLCPSEDAGGGLMRGKLFSQCYLAGRAKHPVCCEALMLGYAPDDAEFLEHQVSVWLESDLPTYHWFHRVPPERILHSYMPFLKMVRRAAYDSSLEGHGYPDVQWPCPRGARDLADARLLHVRQCLGQFLSSYPVEQLTEGLESCVTLHGPGLDGEARSLSGWVQDALADTGASPEVQVASQEEAGLQMQWKFAGGKHFDMGMDPTLASCRIRANFGGAPTDFPLQMKPPSSQLTLAEALFF